MADPKPSPDDTAKAKFAGGGVLGLLKRLLAALRPKPGAGAGVVKPKSENPNEPPAEKAPNKPQPQSMLRKIMQLIMRMLLKKNPKAAPKPNGPRQAPQQQDENEAQEKDKTLKGPNPSLARRLIELFMRVLGLKNSENTRRQPVTPDKHITDARMAATAGDLGSTAKPSSPPKPRPNPAEKPGPEAGAYMDRKPPPSRQSFQAPPPPKITIASGSESQQRPSPEPEKAHAPGKTPLPTPLSTKPPPPGGEL